jgi:hypothetical protein
MDVWLACCKNKMLSGMSSLKLGMSVAMPVDIIQSWLRKAGIFLKSVR